MLLTTSYLESAYLIAPGQPLKPRFRDKSKFVYFLVVNNKYLSHFVDNIIFGISVPDYHKTTVETTFFPFPYMNNIKFTYDKLESVNWDSAYLIYLVKFY